MNQLTVLLLAASSSPSPAPGTPDPDTVNAGWWGFLGLLFLCIAVFFLWKSMNSQLKRVSFDEVPVDPEPAGVEPSDMPRADAEAPGAPSSDVAAVDEPTADR